MIAIEGMDKACRDIERWLKSIERQLPYATAVALNNLAFDVRAKEQGMMPVELDRPTYSDYVQGSQGTAVLMSSSVSPGRASTRARR